MTRKGRGLVAGAALSELADEPSGASMMFALSMTT